jgi:hypothetical protein
MMPTGTARAALVWTAVFFVLGQVALGLFLDGRHADVCDPIYGLRLRHLRQRLAEAPGRPLAVILGSSRPANGIRPASLGVQGTVVFNFAMLGTGPVTACLFYHRLLADGIRPDWVLLEVSAPHLPQAGFFSDARWVKTLETYGSDLPILSRLYHLRWEPLTRLLERRAVPALHWRTALVARYAPCLMTRAALANQEVDRRLASDNLDPDGWLPSPWPHYSPEEFRQRLPEARELAQPGLDHFCVHPVSDGALHELLGECRRQGTRVALIILPEHSALRGWYQAQVKAEYDRYLAGLGREYAAPIIDARTWAADEDFSDPYHLLTERAPAFSERFGRDAVAPLLEGRPLPPEVLLSSSAEGQCR